LADLSFPLHCSWATASHVGKIRRVNEDSLIVFTVEQNETTQLPVEGTTEIPPMGIVAVVADGMGGVRGGAFASKKLQDSLKTLIATEQYCDPHPTNLHSLVNEINFDILDYAEGDPLFEGMGTTLTLSWLRDGTLNLVNVGDSRLYRLRGERFEQLSEDQSFVGKLLRQGEITPEQARVHPQRNVIDQAVGSHPEGLLPDISTFSYIEGDVYLLCSDGLNEELTDESILEVIRNYPQMNLRRIAGTLIDKALASGGRDNISTILLSIMQVS
jgi:serine/threonine protein phosphatase PrpC